MFLDDKNQIYWLLLAAERAMKIGITEKSSIAEIDRDGFRKGTLELLSGDLDIDPKRVRMVVEYGFVVGRIIGVCYNRRAPR